MVRFGSVEETGLVSGSTMRNPKIRDDTIRDAVQQLYSMVQTWHKSGT